MQRLSGKRRAGHLCSDVHDFGTCSGVKLGREIHGKVDADDEMSKA